MSLGENLDPLWVEQRCHLCVVPFLKALPLETLIRIVLLAPRCLVTVWLEAAPVKTFCWGFRRNLPATSFVLQLIETKTSSAYLPYLSLL